MNTTVSVDTRSFSCGRNVDEAEVLVDVLILDFVTESAHYTYKDAQHNYDTATRSPYQFTDHLQPHNVFVARNVISCSALIRTCSITTQPAQKGRLVSDIVTAYSISVYGSGPGNPVGTRNTPYFD